MILHIMEQQKTVTNIFAIRHEYWEEEKYKLPLSDKNRHPFCVLIEY